MQTNYMKTVMLMLVFSGLATSVNAQTPDTGSFFVRLGRDTIAVERYTRTASSLNAEALLRTPITRHLKLNVTFKADGSISWWEVVNSPVAGTPNSGPVVRTLVTLLGDSAQVELWLGANQRPTRKVAIAPGVLPLQVPFYSTYETAIQRARKTPGDTLLRMLSGPAPLDYTIRYPRPDSITLFHPQAGLNVVKLDRNGRLLSFNGEGTTFKILATRSKAVDLKPWSARFAKADAEGKAIGFLSPRDTVDVNVGNAMVTIEYSQPSKRGRVIFGGIVPWDQVWRTGANAATQLAIENGTMVIGSTRIPPGKYTMWTLPSKSGWKLIINQQTGQWGTVYDPAKDLARVDVKTESVTVPVEKFVIEVTPKSLTDGVMTLTWDRTRVVVPFKMEE
jgi:hypothetical protein